MSYRERIQAALEPLQGTLYRVVESQEEIATTRLVDSIPEQVRLEELLEQSKPARPKDTDQLHYLLATPFRYPPLKYGSRFGRPFEKSLFYGAMTTNTALAETAFYRFVFISHLETPFPKPVKTLHTLFGARIHTDKGIRLQKESWQDMHEALASPSDYRTSQNLGSEMREFGVQAFQFLSARALQAGLYSLPLSPPQRHGRHQRRPVRPCGPERQKPQKPPETHHHHQPGHRFHGPDRRRRLQNRSGIRPGAVSGGGAIAGAGGVSSAINIKQNGH